MDTKPKHRRKALISASDAPGSRIFEWASDARWNQVHTGFQHEPPLAKGLGPYFVGRLDELDRLTARSQRQPAEVPDDLPESERSFITVITNAPGVGKSALLEKFAKEYHAAGGHTVRMTPNALTSHVNFMQALDTTQAGRRARWLRATMTVAKLYALVTGKNALSNGLRAIRAAAKRFGQVPPAELADPNNTMLALKLAMHPVEANPIHVMQTIGELTDGGLVIVMDECQHLGQEPSTRGQVSEFLQQLGDPSERAALGLRTGGIILAGLPDAEQRLAELSKSRVHSMHLHTLPPDDCRELIYAGIAKGDPKKRIDPKITERWVDLLAWDFSQWTHHAYGAAYAAHRMVPAFREIAPVGNKVQAADTVLEWMRSSAARTARDLYQKTTNLAHGYIGAEGILKLISHADRSEGYVDQKTITRLIRQHRKQNPRDPVGQVDDDGAFQYLLHSGLVGRERDADGNPTGNLQIPIPSLIHYTTAKAKAPIKRAPTKKRRPPTVRPKK